MAVAVLGGFLAGQRVGTRSPVGDATIAPSGAASPSGVPVDLSSMSPQEQASRLYDRIMRYGEQGKLDSARFFTTMAMQAYAALGAPDAHARYDIGMIWTVVGDSARARSEAAAILNERPTHLLGLLLAMRSAATPTIGKSYQRRFVEASKTELAVPLPEYSEHKNDIDGALSESRLAKK
jgi:hypothetical protein